MKLSLTSGLLIAVIFLLARPRLVTADTATADGLQEEGRSLRRYRKKNDYTEPLKEQETEPAFSAASDCRPSLESIITYSGDRSDTVTRSGGKARLCPSKLLRWQAQAFVDCVSSIKTLTFQLFDAEGRKLAQRIWVGEQSYYTMFGRGKGAKGGGRIPNGKYNFVVDFVDTSGGRSTETIEVEVEDAEC